MRIHLVTGGCGFIGRNFVKHLLRNTPDYILIVDNLSSGTSPENWLNGPASSKNKSIKIFEDRVVFILEDIRTFFRNYLEYQKLIFNELSINMEFEDVFHFAAVVGGRLKIENDPLAVAIDLSIDAEFFNWAAKVLPKRILYPSSSAAYPVSLQTKENHRALKESDINFNILKNPDLTYGWSKLTGEYLAKIAADKYNIKVTCIRPFSGYGPDQDLNYPIPAIARRIALKQNPIEVWGDGTQSRDFIYIDDVIEGTLKAMDHIHDGLAVNIGSGVKTSFLEVIKILTEIAGYDPEIKLLTDKPVGVHSRYCDIAYAGEQLNWKSKISLYTGFKKVYDKMIKTLPIDKHSIV